VEHASPDSPCADAAESVGGARAAAQSGRRRVLFFGALIGLALVGGGVVVIAGSATHEARLALVAVAAPAVLYAGWWVLFSGSWSRADMGVDASTAHEPTAELIARIFDEAQLTHGEAVPAVRREHASEELRAAFERSLRRDHDGSGANADEHVPEVLRPRFRRGV
jgi:hypothetical protein